MTWLNPDRRADQCRKKCAPRSVGQAKCYSGFAWRGSPSLPLSLGSLISPTHSIHESPAKATSAVPVIDGPTSEQMSLIRICHVSRKNDLVPKLGSHSYRSLRGTVLQREGALFARCEQAASRPHVVDAAYSTLGHCHVYGTKSLGAGAGGPTSTSGHRDIRLCVSRCVRPDFRGPFRRLSHRRPHTRKDLFLGHADHSRLRVGRDQRPLDCAACKEKRRD